MTNLYDPIFDICIQNVSNVKDLYINRLLWSCLIMCIGFKPTCQVPIPSDWNHRDDLCASLLNRLAFENDYNVRLLLMRCIPTVFAPTQSIDLLNDSEEEITQIDYPQLRENCVDKPCLTACRWTKKLAKMCIYHLSCSFGPSADVAFNIRVISKSKIFESDLILYNFLQ